MVSIDLNKPMPDILAQLSAHPVSTRLSLNGTIIVARDIAHAKLKELLDNGKNCRSTLKITRFTMQARRKRQKVTRLAP